MFVKIFTFCGLLLRFWFVRSFFGGYFDGISWRILSEFILVSRKLHFHDI